MLVVERLKIMNAKTIAYFKLNGRVKVVHTDCYIIDTIPLVEKIKVVFQSTVLVACLFSSTEVILT